MSGNPHTVTRPEYDEPFEEAPFSWRAILEIVQALALAVVISVILNLLVVQVTARHPGRRRRPREPDGEALIANAAFRS